MDACKILSKETSIIIYGGGEVGNNCCSRLKAQGYHIMAALDKNKSGDHVIEGIYTWELGTEPAEWDKTDYLVVICLADGMIHKAVADKLYSMGYVYILFLPMDYCMPDKEKRKLTRLYNDVLYAAPSMAGETILSYDRYAAPDFNIENGIICRTPQSVTVWMRLELLFSESLELWQGDKSKIYTRSEYKDKNIACMNPCEALFDYFALKSESYNVYFDSKKQEKSPEEKERELRKREALYRLFKREHDRGMDFFIEGAPWVMWNPDNYCNLVGGHHRTLYLLHEGHGLFPVKMSKGDFDMWCNEAVYAEVKAYVREHKIESFYAPLPHPGFLHFPAEWEDTGRTKLAAVLRYLADKEVSGMTVLDVSSDEGYFARSLDRIGVKASVFQNSDARQRELAQLFNRLLYRHHVIIESGEPEGSCENRKFDIVVAMRHKTDNAISKSRLELLGALCRRYLIMETVKPEETEAIRSMTGLKNYVCIHREYKDGLAWETGVYSE